MATLASLVVSLEANVARFESDLNKAEFMAKKAMDTIGNVSETAMKTVKGAVMAMAAAYTFDAFADGIKGAIASAGELDQMAKKTGATVEALSGLKSAAKLSGTSLEEVGGGLQKLSKAMFEAAGGSQKQSDLFKSLGVEVTDSSGKLRDSGEVMLDLAKKLDSMDSSTQAVATAQMLLGKRGAELLPFMQDLAEIGELNAKVTSEMAAEADMYEKNLVRLEGRKKSLYNTIASALLPVMRDFTDALLASGSMTERLNDTAKQLKQDNVIETWAREGLRAVAAFIDIFDACVRIVRIAGNAIAATGADIVSVLAFMDGIGAEMISEKSLDPVKRRFATLTSDLKSHAESFNEDMVKIWTAPLFLTKLDEQFAQRDAGLKKPVESAKRSFAIPDQRPDKTSPFDSYLDSLNVEAIKDKLGKYEAMIEKGRLLAVKEGRLGDMAKVTATVSSIQSIDEGKRIDAFAHSLDVANQQYEFQNTLIGLNARDQALATEGRKNFLAVEQQIWDAEKSGTKLSAEAQQRLRSEAIKSTSTLVQAVNDRFDAQQKFDETKRINAFTYSLEQANDQYIFQTKLIGLNAQAQEIANVKRKNFLAVEQQIWDAEQSGTKLTADTQQRLRDEAVKSTAVMIKAIEARWDAERSWEMGVTKALNNYIDTISNAAAQSERLFTNAFKGMEDALVSFVQTGKLDFKSLANSIIADLIRIQIQNSVMNPLAQATSGMSLSGMFSSAGNFLSGLFKADGGPVAGGQPYIVGEQGPEWFVPNGAGTIVPNGKSAGTTSSPGNSDSSTATAQAPININFSVRAMDARSFQSAMVQNKAVVVGIVNQALNMRGRYGIT
ncbi:phage tail tape measure C-terminal domain-containing protein, partial [Sphingorhabdus sp.]|uniref:phage tail tape measure C-terminal domain-containing protein n=1 Tax=Sphingorhabdus sp. TaxID=1902408 RepID=UPI0033405A1D